MVGRCGFEAVGEGLLVLHDSFCSELFLIVEKCILVYIGALDRRECLVIVEMYGDTCVVAPHLSCLIDVV